MNKYEVGTVVRYAPKWCSPGEEKYIHIIIEVRDHSDDKDLRACRYLIETQNSKLSHFKPTEMVDEEMIIPV